MVAASQVMECILLQLQNCLADDTLTSIRSLNPIFRVTADATWWQRLACIGWTNCFLQEAFCKKTPFQVFLACRKRMNILQRTILELTGEVNGGIVLRYLRVMIAGFHADLDMLAANIVRWEHGSILCCVDVAFWERCASEGEIPLGHKLLLGQWLDRLRKRRTSQRLLVVRSKRWRVHSEEDWRDSKRVVQEFNQS